MMRALEFAKEPPPLWKRFEAEKHYSALFEEDSYFSPMGGIGLARCKKARGKADEANEALEKFDKHFADLPNTEEKQIIRALITFVIERKR